MDAQGISDSKCCTNRATAYLYIKITACKHEFMKAVRVLAQSFPKFPTLLYF